MNNRHIVQIENPEENKENLNLNNNITLNNNNAVGKGKRKPRNIQDKLTTKNLSDNPNNFPKKNAYSVIKDIGIYDQLNIDPADTKDKLISKANLNSEDKAQNIQTPQMIQELNYIDRENSVLIKSYGAEMYQCTKLMENDSVNPNFLYRHKINGEIRTKMVDWMVEVLAVYKSEDDTLFLAVHIMDLFIDKFITAIRTEEIHLIGITSMFIASKFEDVIPIRMNSVVGKIAHNMFSE